MPRVVKFALDLGGDRVMHTLASLLNVTAGLG